MEEVPKDTIKFWKWGIKNEQVEIGGVNLLFCPDLLLYTCFCPITQF